MLRLRQTDIVRQRLARTKTFTWPNVLRAVKIERDMEINSVFMVTEKCKKFRPPKTIKNWFKLSKYNYRIMVWYFSKTVSTKVGSRIFVLLPYNNYGIRSLKEVKLFAVKMFWVLKSSIELTTSSNYNQYHRKTCMNVVLEEYWAVLLVRNTNANQFFILDVSEICDGNNYLILLFTVHKIFFVLKLPFFFHDAVEPIVCHAVLYE